MRSIFRVDDYLEQQFHIHLNSQQRQAIASQSRYTLLLAVPGSGKTTVLVARTADLIENRGVSSERILTLTFSKESAKDMGRRFAFLFSSLGIKTPVFSTIHSFCYGVLKFYAGKYRRRMPTLLLDQGETSRRQILRRLYLEKEQEFLSEDILESLSNDISLVKNLMMTPDQIEKMETSVDDFYELFCRYERVKKENHLMDFDDMLSHTLDILKKLPPVLQHFQECYDYIQVDEAQDTSKIQFEILRLLAKNKNLFMVGDEDQCIYGFRGAYPEGILNFGKTYPDAEILKIEQNYRSYSEIVDCSSQFIAFNQNRYEKQMTCENPDGQAVFLTELSDYSKQYEAILEERRNLSPGKAMAVLYRNQESVIPVIDILLRNGIPYSARESNLKFFTSFVVRDILSFFTLSYDPYNVEAFERVYYKMMCSKQAFIFAKYNAHRFGSILEAAANTPEMSEYRKKKLLSYQREIEKLSSKRPVSAIQTIEQRLGYLDYLTKRSSSGKNPLNAVLKLNILKTIAWKEADLESYVSHLQALEEEMKTHQNPPEAELYLSTIHSSKGLEFDTVLLLDAMEGILPNQEALELWDNGQAEEMEGEARLFYVAVTRAKSRLVIYTSRFCNDEYVVKSRFISRLKAERAKGETSEKSAVPEEIGGKTLTHRFFGKGIVTSVQDEDSIEVYFEKYGVKLISYSSCIEGNIIRFLE